MKKIVFFWMLVLLSNTFYAQKLPMKQVVAHLTSVGEIPPQENWQDALQNMTIGKMFSVDSVALYLFSSTYIHRYKFFLVKDRDSFQILNCDNFIPEYEIMEKVYTGRAKDSLDHYLTSIIEHYKANYNYHQTPPILDLTSKNREPYYLPRKIVKTQPFFFKEQ